MGLSEEQAAICLVGFIFTHLRDLPVGDGAGRPRTLRVQAGLDSGIQTRLQLVVKTFGEFKRL